MSKNVCLLIASLCFIFNSAHAQLLNPVKWSFEQEKVSENSFDLIFKAEIDKGWTVYSMDVDEDAGPMPTSLTFETTDGLELSGKAVETGKRKEGKDPVFDNAMVIKYLSDEVYEIRQRVVLSGQSASTSGYLSYMTCDDKRCLPPTDVDFSFELSAGETSAMILNESNNQELEENEGQDDLSNLQDPASWSFRLTDVGDGSYDLTAEAQIESDWNIYSYYTADGGPLPTLLTIETPDDIELVGEPLETGDKKQGADPLFGGIQVIKFTDKSPYSITQRIKVPGDIKSGAGYLSYMACNSITCTPPTDVEFQLDFSSSQASISALDVASFTDVDELVNRSGNIIDQVRPTLKASYADPLAECGSDASNSAKDRSILWMFAFGFIGGLLALLTPCVFPMIPLTVSFFTKDTKRKGWMNGLIYAVSIVVIYVTLGLGLTAIFGEEALNRLSTNWIANTLFFLIFVFFAFSFFGYYELTLPQSWTNSSDKMADKGGLIGIFFMAFTLALVSFSCTGPIIGTAIVQAAANKVGPFVVMLGFAIALGLPFGLFAAFPAWLNSLPKSGGWLNTVKVTLGFVELAFAFKFLSVADMTNGWGILRYEPFMIIWILCALGLGLYMFGLIKFPHDSPLKKITSARWVLGLGSFALVVYFASGFVYNPKTESYTAKKLMSGIAPPTHYNFLLDKPEVDPAIKAIYPSYSKCANGINCFKDYYEGLAYAKAEGKPLFLDHTGHGCVNCRLVEEHIWVNDDIREKLNSDFVLVSLYVDDDKKLDETLVSKKRGSKIRNVGNKWADFQIVNFNQNSQPLYVMVTNDEEVIAAPRGHVPSEGQSEYLEYLNCGLTSIQ